MWAVLELFEDLRVYLNPFIIPSFFNFSFEMSCHRNIGVIPVKPSEFTSALTRLRRWDDSISRESFCSVAVATHAERRHLCRRTERKMEESSVRDAETGV